MPPVEKETAGKMENELSKEMEDRNKLVVGLIECGLGTLESSTQWKSK